MKSVKKILMGIAINLFGIAISSGPDSFLFIGWIVSIIGLFMSFIGYYFTEDE